MILLNREVNTVSKITIRVIEEEFPQCEAFFNQMILRIVMHQLDLSLNLQGTMFVNAMEQIENEGEPDSG